MTQNSFQGGPSPFTRPGSAGGGTYIDVTQLHGRLILIEIKDVSQQQSTIKGAAPGTMVPVVTADVAVLDGGAISHRINKDNGQPEAELDPAIVPGQLSAIIHGFQFWGVSAKQLQQAGGPGTLVLVRGRIGERRGGFNPPFLLDDPTPEDEARGMAWLQRRAMLEQQGAQAAPAQLQQTTNSGYPGPGQQFPGQVTSQEWQQAAPQGYAQLAPPPAGPQPWGGQPQAPNPYAQQAPAQAAPAVQNDPWAQQ